MKRSAMSLSLMTLASTSLLLGCDEQSLPPDSTVSATYSTCIGPRGGCSSDCCIETNVRDIPPGTRAVCRIRPGEGDLARLSFRFDDESFEHGIEAEGVLMSPDANGGDLVESCELFGVRDALNRYEAESCRDLEMTEDRPFGGGCEVSVTLDDANVLRGTFTCQEIRLPSQELYLSTVHSGDVASGTFVISNCAVRL